MTGGETVSHRLHGHLIGTPDSRGLLNTPALILDAEAFDRNVARMAAFAKKFGLNLRPHAKSHKSAAVARAQLAAGAVGLCCAKLGEADPGIHRTGVASPQDAVALARSISERPSVCYAGVQFYCGAQQHIQNFAERRNAIVERTAYLIGCLNELSVAGLSPRVVTGGGTGSHVIDAELGVLTELQVGSYLFMDREYAECDLDGSGRASFETALMVDARVISANATGLVTIDAGLLPRRTGLVALALLFYAIILVPQAIALLERK